MAIAFDATTKIITLDSFTVSASELWSRWVDWVALTDNLKYPPAFSQLGGVAPVALYVYLENGWQIRPQEAAGTTVVEGLLLVQGGGDPFVPTIGSFSTQIAYKTPVEAVGVNVGGGGSTGGFTPTDRVKLNSLENADLSTLETDVAAIEAVIDTNLDGKISEITGTTPQEIWDYILVGATLVDGSAGILLAQLAILIGEVD